MAKNEVFRDADHLSLPVPAGKKAGDPVRVGGLNGVCQTDRNASAAALNADGTANTAYTYAGGNPAGHATVWLKGAHRFEVDFAISNVGDPVYITSAGALTATASGNSLYGHALTTKTAPAGPLVVRISN